MKVKPILKNAARCKECGAVIESKHRHDFVWHVCNKAEFFLDGGKEYIRYGGDMDKIELLTEYGPEEET